jgi:hypothetical protein
MLAYGLMLINDARILNRHVETAKRTDERPKGYVFVIQTGSFVFHFFVWDLLVVVWIVDNSDHIIFLFQ